MSTAHVLLGLLAHGGSRHGYELKRAHDTRLPRIRPLGFGQIYATLNRLVRDGLITVAGQDQDGGPARTAFTLTDSGRAELAGWLGRVEPPAPYLTDALFVKVMVALLAEPDDRVAHDYLVAQRAAHAARMRELTAAKSDPAAGLAEVAAADYALNHLSADLTWMQTTLARLGRLRTELNEGNDDGDNHG